MKHILMLSLFIVGATIVNAQDSAKTLQEVVITARKTPVKQAGTGKLVTVISRAEIEHNSGKTLGQLLERVPGLTINGASQTPGSVQTVYLRGASAGNTLILIDGVPLYDPSGITGEFDLNNFDISNLEKIEILKGAQSTLYGSDAIAGVINLITRKPDGGPINTTIQLEAGSYGTLKGSAWISGRLKHGFYYSGTYAKTKTNGFSSAWDSTGSKTFDDDGFDRDAAQFTIGWNPSDKMDLSLFGKYSNYRGDIDAGAFMDDKDYTYQNDHTVVGFKADRFLKNGVLRLQYYFSQYNRNFEDDSNHVGGYSKYQHGRYNGSSHFAEVYTHIDLNKYVALLAGVDFRSNKTNQEYIYLPDYGFPATPISPDSAHTNQFSGYASLAVKTEGGFQIDLGGRWNHHSVYGANFTSSINPFFVFNDRLKVFGQLSSAYKVPTLYQLYSEFGNRKLKSEYTTSTQAGLQFASQNISGSIAGFWRDTKDLITFYTDPTTFQSHYINADRQSAYGIELQTQYVLSKKWSATLNYSYTDGTIKTTSSGKDTSYFNLYKRPKHQLFTSLQFAPAKAWYFSINARWISKAFESIYMAPPYQLDGYFLLGFHSAYKAAKWMQLFTNVQNITHAQYFETRGYNTRGFNLMAGVLLEI